MKKITAEFALAALTLFLLSGCGGSDTESDEQADLQSTYMSDFKWAVGQMEDVYDDYDVETDAWRLLNASEIYLTSANEMNGADYAVVMVVEFAKKMPGKEKWVEGGSYTTSYHRYFCGDPSDGYPPAKPIEIQVASWDGNRQLPCLTEFKKRMELWKSEQK